MENLRQNKKSAYGGNVGRQAEDQSADVLFERCKFMQYCRNNAITMLEPYWFAMTSNLVRCQDGAIIARELSNLSPELTERMVLHITNNMHPAVCDHIAVNLKFACPVNGCGVKAPCCFAIKKID